MSEAELDALLDALALLSPVRDDIPVELMDTPDELFDAPPEWLDCDAQDTSPQLPFVEVPVEEEPPPDVDEHPTVA